MGMGTSASSSTNYYVNSITDNTSNTVALMQQQYAYQQALVNVCYAPTPEPKKENTMELYTVYLVYAEDRKAPVVKRVDGVLAKNTEDAKVKSGLMKEVQDDWDSDYLNFICEHIGTVNVKAKPTEVKSV